MATTEWSAAFETTPAGNTSRKLGDDRIRELKLSIRERLQKGGHFMQDAGAGFPKDGRHVVGVGDGPTIYKSDATTEAVRFTDTNVELKAGVNITSVDGINGSVLKANAATFGKVAFIDVTGAPAATATYTSGSITTHTLGTPKGQLAWALSIQFEADAADNDVAMILQADYLNTAVWSTIGTNAGLSVPARGSANKNNVIYTICGLDVLATPSDGGTLPLRVQVVNSHATANITFMRIRLLTIELRK